MRYTEQTINDIHRLDSRKAVGFALENLYNNDKRITCVYADVGSRFSVKGKMGPNDVEIGIAEQTLIPMLGGMYHEGYIPFGIAYAPFITMRAADQIRMTVGEMGLGIKLVGGSAGLVSGNLGAASLALDDIAAMRAIPNMTIVSPSDCFSEVKLFEYAACHDEPVYIRLTGNTLDCIYDKDIDLNNNKSMVVFEGGTKAVIYSTGSETYRAIKAAEVLKMKGIGVTVVDMLFLKPIDTSALEKFSAINTVFTVEEHNVIGGLGSAVSEYISENTNQTLYRIGVNDSYLYPDSYERLLHATCLNTDGLVETILEKL